MAWIESHQSLANHPKLLKLIFITGCDRDRCIGKLSLLWWWALDYAEDGDLQTIQPEVLGRAMDINDPMEAKKFIEALIECRFIDPETFYLHDWLDYAGRYLKTKYHTSNPSKYDKILKKYLGKPKGGLKSHIPKHKPTLTDLNLPKDTHKTVKDSRVPDTYAKQLFDQFWAAYPKHKARAEAERAFLKIHPDEQLLARMLSSIERAKTSDDWKNRTAGMFRTRRPG